MCVISDMWVIIDVCVISDAHMQTSSIAMDAGKVFSSHSSVYPMSPTFSDEQLDEGGSGQCLAFVSAV